VRDRVHPHVKGNSNVPAARCGIVAVVLLKGPLEVAESFAGTGLRAAHQAEARTTLQTSRKKPESRRRGRRSRKQAEGDAPAKGTWRSRRAALKRERLDRLEGGNVKTNRRGRKAGRRRNQKKCRSQQVVEVPSSRANTNVTGMSFRKRRNGDRPVGYSG
jgi:hypothetical protein